MSKKEESRGTKDEIESLTIILDENPYLKSRVLDKLRKLKADYEQRTNGAKEKGGA